MKFLDAIKERARLLKRDTYALYFAYRDPRLSWKARAFTALVVAYAFSPVDLVPDFIPVLGYLDDLVLIPLGISLALKMIPPEVMADARRKAEENLSGKKPVNWVVGALIIALWIILAALILRAVWSKFQSP